MAEASCFTSEQEERISEIVEKAIKANNDVLIAEIRNASHRQPESDFMSRMVDMAERLIPMQFGMSLASSLMNTSWR